MMLVPEFLFKCLHWRFPAMISIPESSKQRNAFCEGRSTLKSW
jgi:hypothetical protein